MTRALALLVGLLLISPVFVAPRATQAQQVPNPMSKDGANAELPGARNNLELGTVKSEGGTPPNADAVTRFYTYGGAGSALPDYHPKPQFEIASHPGSNEYTIEQAGLAAPSGVGVGQGATRVCWAPFSNNAVNCNYVAMGRDGRHRFGNGAGFLAELGYQGEGSTTGWPKLLGSDDAVARLTSEGVGADIELELRAKGNADVSVYNDVGGKVAAFLNGLGSPNNRYIRVIGGLNTAEPRVQGYSDTVADVGLRLQGKGTGRVTVENDEGVVATFDSAGADGGVLAFTAAPPSGAGVARLAKIQSGGVGVQVLGQNFVMSTKTANHTVLGAESGTRFDNIGATGSVTFTLPAHAGLGGLGYGYNYCFSVDAAFSVIVKASGTDKIASGASNSAAGGQISSAAPYASVCVTWHKVGQWIVWATADRTQWTVL